MTTGPAGALGRRPGARGVVLSAIPFVIAGLAGGLIAVQLATAELKYLVTGLVGIVGVAGLLAAGGLGLARTGLLVVMGVGLSLNVSITFLLHTITEGQHVPNVGGAAGITVTVVFLSAILLIGQNILRRRVVPVPLDMVLPWLAFALVGTASVVVAPDPALVGFELIRIVFLLVVLTAASTLSGREIPLFLAILAGSVALQATISILQVVLKRDFGLGFFGEQQLAMELVDYATRARATGTIGHPNILAYFFEIQLPVMVALALTADRTLARLAYAGAATLGLFALIATLSRAGWLSMAMLLPLVVVILAGRRLASRRGIVAMAIGILAVTAGAIMVGPLVMDRLFGDDGGSLSHRAPLNAGAIGLLEQSPIIGHGLNNFAPAFAIRDTTGFARIFADTNHVVHNMYLLVAAETGIIGLVAFLSIFAVAILRAWRVYRDAAAPWMRAAGLGIGFGLIAQLVHGFVDPGFRLSLPISQLIAVMFGLLVALSRPQGAFTRTGDQNAEQ